MGEQTIDKRNAERALAEAGLTSGSNNFSPSTGYDMYQLKTLVIAGLQQNETIIRQNGELIDAFSRVADALERIEKHMDPQVRKGKPMKLDGMGK